MRAKGSDVYGGWRYQYSEAGQSWTRRFPLTMTSAIKLDQLQDAFANEWLWLKGDPDSAVEAAAYARDELAVEDVNVKHRRLGKLKNAPVWTYESHGLNLDILEYLSARWPLDYGKE